MSTFGNTILRVFSYVVGAALVVYGWYEFSPFMIQMLDLNLVAIKFVCGLLPDEYGTMTEAALRVSLHADKALLLAEGGWVVSGFIHLFRVAFR
ncbi:MAG: hypothetical protein O2794_02930 [bacterium]|nr:hypothetical protein [bacterium]